MNRQQLIELAQSQYPHDTIKALQDKYGFDPKGMTKFYNHEFQWNSCAERVEWLGVRQAPPVLRTLDIGPAVGHFPFILKCLGHDVNTIEVPNFPAYTDAVEALGIPCTKAFVKAKQPLPGDHRNLDLVTATGVTFDVSEDPNAVSNGNVKLWTVDEWKFFLDDMLRRVNPHGRIMIGFNYNYPCVGPHGGYSEIWITNQSGFFHWLRSHPLVASAKLDIPRLTIHRNGISQ